MLEISFEDLKASKILYENKFYPQSVFYFQQSTEKAIKYLGLNANIIDKKDLLSDIGHKTLKIFKKAIKKSFDQFPFNKQFDVDKEFQIIQDSIKRNDLKDTIPFIINQINEFKAELPNLPFDYNKISNPNDLIDTINKIDPKNPDLIKIREYSDDIVFSG